jgi:hypothetical protein
MTLFELRLQALLYVLMRDVIPAGDLEDVVTAVIQQTTTGNTEDDYSMPTLARLAGEMVADLAKTPTRLPAPGHDETEVL